MISSDLRPPWDFSQNGEGRSDQSEKRFPTKADDVGYTPPRVQRKQFHLAILEIPPFFRKMVQFT